MGMPTVIFGTNPRDGKMFIDHSVDTFAAYCGAVKGQDGWGGMNVSFGNLIRATAEINESIFPIRQLWRDYDTDTGGAGEYRGNCGSLYRKQVLTPATIYTYVVGKRYPMPGIAGGRPGSPNRLIARAGGAHAFEVGTRPATSSTRRASGTSITTAAAAAGAIPSRGRPRRSSRACSTRT